MGFPKKRLSRVSLLGGATVVLVLLLIGAVMALGRGDDAAPTESSGAPVPETTAVPTTDVVEPSDDDASVTTSTLGSSTTDDSEVPATTSTALAPTTVADAPETTVHDVPAREVEVRDPIDLEETGDFGTGVTAEVLEIRAVDGVARRPGEVSGPALRIEVRLTNDTDEAIDLAGARIDVAYGPDRIPGLILSEPDVVLFPLTLPPRSHADAASVFVVPLDQRDQIQVAVWYTVDAPIIVFEGSAPIR